MEKLLPQLNKLADASNTIIVIEHDMQVIAESNWIIYIGPGAGKGVGIILYSGNVDRLLKYKESRQPHF